MTGRPPRAVLFDLDNTLVDRDAAFVRWVGNRVPTEALPALVALDAGGHGPRPRVFAAIAAITGEPVAEVHRAFFAKIGAHCRLRDDARATLAHLRGRVKIGVVTNGDPTVQHSKIAGAGVQPWVDTIVVSGDVGVHKPGAAPFLAALARLEVAPTDAWMVGDHPDNDIAGAAALGLGTVFVTSRWFDGCPGADHQASDLRTVPWP